MSQGEASRALTNFFALWGSRRGEQEVLRPRPVQAQARPATNGNGGTDRSLSTKAFGKFLAALSHREAPVLLDLGPVVGNNINYFGERLGCKFFVEDLYDNVERQVRGNNTDLAAFFEKRFPQADASFDGILCWDIFDYLDKRAAQIVAREMTRLLKPGGALLTFFATAPHPGSEYTRFLVVDDNTLKHKPYPAVRGRQQVFVNRDIDKMFEGLTVADSYLLMTKTREMVFRKPEKKAAPPAEAQPAINVAPLNATELLRMAKVKTGGRIYTSPAAAKGTV